MQESKLLEKILGIGRKIIPKSLFKFVQPIYHYKLALLGAIIYRFPARKLTVIGVTGTKGKTTTVELVNAILEAAGYKTALASTLRYKIGEKEWRNLFKMTLRGRFFTQKFLRQAVDSGCSHAVIEISSEGVPQFRHKFLFIDALIFTNLAPEHIESHGSYENYLKAKLSIAKELEGREGAAIIANTNDKEGEKFLELNIKNKIPYSLNDAIAVKASEKGSSFQIGKIVIHSKLPGIFNVSNMLGAIAYAKFAGISPEKIKEGLEKINFVRGRMEKINEGQEFDVVVDYAHTPDSLKAVYETYNNHKKICILGNTGGGRDKWKREEMGKIADKYCDHIILANEDPYDENPLEIVEEIKKGIKRKPYEIIMDRREAINSALKLALTQTKELTSNKQEGEIEEMTQVVRSKNKIAVLITGKGTDPYIMGPNGTKQEWDDATVVREELRKVLKN
jgi:UDP-N-acetylmuramoyl-L-alanyl-D-glutamate--2,6-diaminopimelate ligase